MMTNKPTPITLRGNLSIINMAINIPVGAPNMLIEFNTIESFKLIPCAINNVGNQLIKVY